MVDWALITHGKQYGGYNELTLFPELNVVSSDMTSLEALIVLNMLEGVGPILVRRLLEEFERPENILSSSEASLLRRPGIGPEVAASISGWESLVDLKAELSRCQEFGCEPIEESDPRYPDQLRQIYDPPLVLYVKGELQGIDRQGIAIVGSRRSTHYGRETARKLSIQLARARVTVVSGGARGIDSSAHYGALHGEGRTICVLGNGINLVYPPENRELFERIAGQGAVMTQFPFNRPADRQSFPIRNRIVAGMTLGTVVVEANVKSGALITATMANDYGRQVYAVPGPIHSPRSKGCHQLIKNGAKLCESVDDILSEFEYLFPQQSAPPGASEAMNLDDTQRKMLSLIQEQTLHIDELVALSGLSVPVASMTLLQLEMKGLIAQQPGHLYSIRQIVSGE